MIRLAVSVEGQTEEEFVKVVLDEHLRPLGVAPEPVLIGIGARAGGGSVTVRRLASDMALLYHSHDSVTSLVDFYGFQRKGDRSVEALETHLREKTGEQVGAGWDENKVFPYVQMYEFEGLLFSNVDVFATQIDFPRDFCGGATGCPRAVQDSRGHQRQLRNGSEQAHRKCSSEVPQASSRPHIDRGNRSRQDPCGVSAIRCVGEASGGVGG